MYCYESGGQVHGDAQGCFSCVERKANLNLLRNLSWFLDDRPVLKDLDFQSPGRFTYPLENCHSGRLCLCMEDHSPRSRLTIIKSSFLDLWRHYDGAESVMIRAVRLFGPTGVTGGRKIDRSKIARDYCTDHICGRNLIR